ncbi:MULTISPECIES: (2Fe-2S)-binding protein [Leptospira]|uniref:Bacterioferritin-associated ferredoxin n=7 Tax=Leptospira TaxID=171 RepID=A0A4R9GCE8_9LEPT|nr:MULTISPECIES: (2Fe-2S)-binding protein [Leptospira]EIE02800.1 2Fe-2S iron-sulfur cluster-binding domain protein [Leptospira licerasiae serovar Varillal str. VAR 010]EJZ42564.1 2Fe-2S iron-sulfur cluster-binding domain protein [Leptospira licerasiae str. MMD4847]PJZ24155.1 ferredoxin [Leptospira hartskeerlii]PJZ35149.1 ferredoxin [Leptospira hartskeerlii]PKA17894.1 ferredoxin [Leptospira haakeii]
MNSSDFSQIDLNALMRPRKVCVCNQVSEEDITNSIRRGNDTLGKLMRDTSCCTGCGTCRGRVLKLLSETLASKPQ